MLAIVCVYMHAYDANMGIIHASILKKNSGWQLELEQSSTTNHMTVQRDMERWYRWLELWEPRDNDSSNGTDIVGGQVVRRKRQSWFKWFK